MIDLDFVRRQFPAFATPSLKEHSFFENAGGSYMCQHVIDRFNRYTHDRRQLGSGKNAPSAKSKTYMLNSTQSKLHYHIRSKSANDRGRRGEQIREKIK